MFPLSCIICACMLNCCNKVRWAWLDWDLPHPSSVLWHCWLGHQTCKTIISEKDLWCGEWDIKPYSTNDESLQNSNCSSSGDFTGWSGSSQQVSRVLLYSRQNYWGGHRLNSSLDVRYPAPSMELKQSIMNNMCGKTRHSHASTQCYTLTMSKVRGIQPTFLLDSCEASNSSNNGISQLCMQSNINVQKHRCNACQHRDTTCIFNSDNSWYPVLDSDHSHVSGNSVRTLVGLCEPAAAWSS